MLVRMCLKCGETLPATTKYFHRDSRARCGLQSKCKQCCMKYNRQHRKEMAKYNREYRRKYHKKLAEQKKRDYSTLKGYLGYIYRVMKQRCVNPNRHNYHRYGGRGIKNKFKSLNDFRNYVVNGLGITDMSQIKGLRMDRINNDGHYEPGNIRFITNKENCNNR